MVLYCAAHELDALCADLSGKARLLRLQAKGGSMFPFIRSGDWVDLELGAAGRIGKGDIVLFRKDGALYLHRVLARTAGGFLVKGDMSSAADGTIDDGDIIGRAVAVTYRRRRVDLRSRPNRIFARVLADAHLLLRYPLLAARIAGSFFTSALVRIQGIKGFRDVAKKVAGTGITVRPAVEEDEEQLRDLYRMAGHDVREGLAGIAREGFWLVAERERRLIGGLTVSRSEKDPGLWLIFGLEVELRFRGLGAGRALVKNALERAKENGCREVGLFVNKRARPALALYRGLGFGPAAVPDGFNRSDDELYLSRKIS